MKGQELTGRIEKIAELIKMTWADGGIGAIATALKVDALYSAPVKPDEGKPKWEDTMLLEPEAQTAFFNTKGGTEVKWRGMCKAQAKQTASAYQSYIKELEGEVERLEREVAKISGESEARKILLMAMTDKAQEWKDKAESQLASQSTELTDEDIELIRLEFIRLQNEWHSHLPYPKGNVPPYPDYGRMVAKAQLLKAQSRQGEKK